MENKINLIEKTENFVKSNKNVFIISFCLTIIIIIGAAFLNSYNKSQNEKISEKFITAGIFLSSNDKSKANQIYKDIIQSENKFYSILSLNSILDNNLENNNSEVLQLFKTVENSKITKEQKNLIKFKKALYLIKISKMNEGNKLLQEILNSNSIWKNAASEISK